jgi:hypothetical protein
LDERVAAAQRAATPAAQAASLMHPEQHSVEWPAGPAAAALSSPAGLRCQRRTRTHSRTASAHARAADRVTPRTNCVNKHCTAGTQREREKRTCDGGRGNSGRRRRRSTVLHRRVPPLLAFSLPRCGRRAAVASCGGRGVVSGATSSRVIVPASLVANSSVCHGLPFGAIRACVRPRP